MDFAAIIQAALPGIITAVFASLVAVRLAIRRTMEEKWWERKYEAYSSLLEALHHLKNYAAEHYDSQFSYKAMNEEKKKELSDDWRRFSREMNKLSDLAAFRVSSESVTILEEYRRKKEVARNSEDLFDWIEGDLEAVKECLTKLTAAAKKDLKIK